MSQKKEQISEAFIAENSKLQGYIQKQVRNREDAEDIMQDVFESLTGGFDEILNLSGVVGWMYSVAKHKIIDFKRKKKTTLLDDFNVGNSDDEEALSLSDILPSFESLADDKIMQDLIWEQINRSLKLLPDSQRIVFEMHELQGLSFKQISEITGDSINTLLGRKRYAILFLREQLQELYDNINS